MPYFFTSGAPKGPEIQSHDYFPELDPKLSPRDWGKPEKKSIRRAKGRIIKPCGTGFAKIHSAGVSYSHSRLRAGRTAPRAFPRRLLDSIRLTQSLTNRRSAIGVLWPLPGLRSPGRDATSVRRRQRLDVIGRVL